MGEIASEGGVMGMVLDEKEIAAHAAPTNYPLALVSELVLIEYRQLLGGGMNHGEEGIEGGE